MRIMQIKTPVALALGGILLLSACDDPRYAAGGEYERTRQGAITGAVVGGILGAAANGSNDLRGAAIGATLGGIAGGVIGSALDQQAADLRRQTGGNVGVVNTGDSIVVTMPQDILFATDSTQLRPDLQSDLIAVANNLRSYPDTRVQVIGHTDSTGSAAYNQDLSQRRANAVAAVLIQSGVSSSRITAFGVGEDQPIASNQTDAGRAQNRRVEIVIRPN